MFGATSDNMPVVFFTLLFISLCMYQAGMILNDVADIDEDSRERPFRPIPSGKITAIQAKGIAIALFLVANTVALLHSASLLLGTLILSLLILTYNFFAKSAWWRPFVMGSIRTQNWLLVTFALPGMFVEFLPIALLVGVYTTMVTFIARDETTSLTESSVRWIKQLLLVWMMLMLYVAIGHFSSFMVILLVAGSWFAWQFYLVTQRSTDNIQREVMKFLKLMVVLDGVFLASFGYILPGVACISLVLLSSTVAKKVYMT